MAYYVRAPGTCGEFLQGSIDGQNFLVTCPINRYSYALSQVAHPLSSCHLSLQPKAELARRKVLDFLGIPEKKAPAIYVRSEIPQGKGMASSSADISVAAMATALACGRELSFQELEKIALSIEPSDAAFYPSVIQFDYLKGRISRSLGTCPAMTIMIFDEGGIIDTVAFNGRPDLPELIREKEPLIRESLKIFKEGMAFHDIGKIGQACTISSFANQRILYKRPLYEFHEIGQNYSSTGTIIAHSGTVMGLLFPCDAHGLEECRKEISIRLPKLTYVDTVETTSEGLIFTRK